MTVLVKNWKGAIQYRANSVERVKSVQDIVAIVTDTSHYTSPVRAKGSHHSTTDCVVAEGGTVVDLSGMNEILEIDREACTIRMQAGVLHIDAARELEKHGLQFFVNVEIGNLTVGSGACGATKDASFVAGGRTEYGQVSSYCIGMKTVQADGSILEVTEADEELLQMMRGSYGMLGIIFEVLYKVKPIKPMAVEHVAYRVEEFVERLDELIAQERSMMLYLFPFRDYVVVEYRYDGEGEIRSNSWQWRLRNWVWKTGSPAFARVVTSLLRARRLRSWVLDSYNRLSQRVLTWILHGSNTSPADQIIRYPETAGFASYTFSIWSFPQESYAAAILDYYEFCKDYFARTGFRCDLLNVGYRIAADRQSIFSYTRNGPALTLDPVATGAEGWNDFLSAYNEFSSQRDGKPLFNQTWGITPAQARRAFGAEIERFQVYRQRHDPGNRFYTEHFRTLFEPQV